MEWVLGLVTVVAVLAVPGVAWVLSWREARTTRLLLDHIRDAQGIGGLPRELWMEQQKLRERTMTLEERKFDLEAPLKAEAWQAKIRANGMHRSGALRDPERG